MSIDVHADNAPARGAPLRRAPARGLFRLLAEGYLREREALHRAGRGSGAMLALARGTLRRYLLPYWAEIDVRTITVADVDRYWHWRRAFWRHGMAGAPAAGPWGAAMIRGRRPGAASPSPNTLHVEWTVMRAVIRHAVRIGVLDPGVIVRLRRPRERAEAWDGLDWRELLRLRRALRAGISGARFPRVRTERELLECYVILAAATGLPAHEICRLRWRDISLHRCRGRARTLIMAGHDEQLCRAGLFRQLEKLRQRGYRTGDEDLVFTFAHGRPVNPRIGLRSLIQELHLGHDRKGRKRGPSLLQRTHELMRG